MQDTPSIRITYSAKITVEKPYVVKMSAIESAPTDNGDGTITYNFKNEIPVASYLLAIAIGNLSYASTGKRTGVISEPGPDALDKYVKELEDLESYLDAAEKWLTPYIWGNYTIIILPASFPYGGMENPLLTFASPTIIVGDKSQVYVATHEIAHSWTGNQVTCKDWSNMWLNEGFTVFEERKVTAILKNSKDFALREAQLGNVSLWVDINGYGLDNTYSSLHPVLNGNNPDESYSQLPYEKGFQFLTYMETLLPSQDDFQEMIQQYILKYSLKSVTWEDFQQSWTEYTSSKYNATYAASIQGSVDWDKWVFQGGANPQGQDVMSFATAQGTEFENLADAYISLNGKSHPSNYADYLNVEDPQLKVIFLNRLTARINEISLAVIQLIDQDYKCTSDPNPEIGQRWLPLALAFKLPAAYDGAHTLVGIQGRMKYLNPIYQALVNTGRRDLAWEWLQEFQDFYHPIAYNKVYSIIFYTLSEEQELMNKRTEQSLLSRYFIY